MVLVGTSGYKTSEGSISLYYSADSLWAVHSLSNRARLPIFPIQEESE